MTALLHVYETARAYRAYYGHKPTLKQLARACGLKRWQTYNVLVGLRRRGMAR